MKPQRLKFVFVVRLARIGSTYRAHLEDDDSIVATGETPMRAIRNLADDLVEEDDRLEKERRP
ncbi:MAG: hypothetical protein L6Q98_17720 [Anaerolineae bacterium]|nr:hypothetical protein [Anaerolineae bacterium]NUQ05954.1 hypothetical protein [Anaerolineae bacterium]